MVILFKKDELLYAKCKLNLKRPVRYQNKVFEIGEHEEFLLPEEVMAILTANGNVKVWNGKKFLKLNLGQFSDVVMKKLFRVELFVEEKKPVVQPKEEVKPPVVEEPKEEVKEEVEEKEVPENKKKRHKQNQQGGDK